ncbi:hypothetical protein BO70DRAFT_362604 [Aspergillus heteromorphus CBS 117.55]|uniref:Uncharacterized protein n=1 Tax=Aspergillus heteromorphus CBS 117.55 TaxID=1448321 RepID=A0A317W3T3_9EURO|nr:uncharacterized protein BO70DRAFT_362604 [Aspergillus heteromorphus CBS 117.55]PWY80655.1 hypothetical protein BO70DRAFT_362604 [Aspergillus heteromorphus CBS 117.55]
MRSWPVLSIYVACHQGVSGQAREGEKKGRSQHRASNPPPSPACSPMQPHISWHEKTPHLQMKPVRVGKKTGSFSLIERVILSAGAMLIFSVSFQIDQMPEGT